jgi:hypothetical protein
MPTSINQYEKAVPARKISEPWEHETEIDRESFSIASDSFTLIMGRSVRENVDLCSKLAIDLARTGKNVVLFNTFATKERLLKSLESGRSEELPLQVEDVPIGDWDTGRIEGFINFYGVQAIFINSFEYGALTQWQKSQMATSLLKLQRRTGLTIVLFMHRIEHTMRAGDVGRGPLGSLTPFAVQVVQVGAIRSFTAQPARAKSGLGVQHSATAQPAATQSTSTQSKDEQPTQAQPAEKTSVHEKAIEERESDTAILAQSPMEYLRSHAPLKPANESSFVLTKPSKRRAAMVGT